MAGLHFDITGDNSNFIRKLHECENGVKNTSKQIEQSGLGIEELFNRMTRAAAAFGAGFTVKELVSNIIQVRGEFQQLEVAFKTMLGSEDKSNSLMQQLVKTAATTPFDLQGVANGAKQLLAYGENVENVNDDLIRLGNIAAGLSQPLGDIVYLYGTTMTQGRLYTQDLNQFTGRGIPMIRELAKQFNVAENEVKGLVEAGRVGFPEVQKVIMSLTNEGGMFFNLMQEQSKTITGQISNIEDAISTMFNEIGKASEGIINDALSGVSYLIENYEEVGMIIASIAASYGTYKAALVAVNVAERVNIMLLRQAVIEKRVAAAANITLSNSMAIAAARGKMFALIQNNIISSLKGVGKTLSNPYVLFAAAVGSATYGLYKFYTRETEVERMQRQYNDAKETSIRREEEHKAKVDELINSIENETTAQMDRVGAIEALKQIYPDIIEKYIDEEGHLKNLIALKKELAEFDANKKANQNQVDLKSYDERIKSQEEYIDRMRTNDQSAFDDEIAKLEELRRQREITRQKVVSDYINSSISGAKSMSDDELKNTIKTYKDALSQNADREWFDSNQEFKVDEIKQYVSALEDLQKARLNAVRNKKYWEEKKKEAEDSRNALDVSKKNSEEWNKYTEQIQDAQKQIDKYSSSSKQEKQAKKESETQLRQQEHLAEQLLSLRRQNQQDEIDLMQEGADKKLKQIDLDYQKELDAIDKQREDWNKAQKGKLTSDQESQLLSSEENAFKAYEKSIKEANKAKLEADRKAWQDYFIEFGNYQDKRKNLIQKYDDEIDKLQVDSPEYAVKTAEKSQALAQLDEQYGKLAKAMADLFEDASDKSVNAIQAIIDKYELLVSYLSGGNNVTTENLKAVGFTDKDLKSIEDGTINIKDVTDAIKNLKGTLTGKSPFKKFAEDIKEGVEDLKNSKGNTDAIGRGISKIGNAVTQFSGPLKEFSSNIGNIFGFDDSKVQGAIDAISGLGQTAAGVGQIMSGDIVGGAMSAVSGISSVVSAFEGMFGADYSQYNKMKAEYDALNDVWDRLISKKREYIDISYGDEARKAGEEAEDLLRRKMQSNYKLGLERLNAGTSAGSHSIGVRQRKGMSEQGWNELKKAAENIGFNFWPLAEGRMEGLFSLTADQLEKLQKQAPTFWAKLDGEVQNYLNEIIDCNTEIGKMQSMLDETMTGVSFDSFYDSFVSTLSDMSKSSKDMADEFGEYLKKAILENLVANKYRSKIEQLYNDWVQKSDSNGDGIFDLTSKESAELKEAQKALAEQIIAERDAMADVFGWGSSSISQSSTSRGFGSEMTHEDAGELSGRFTALQISNEEIKNLMMSTVLGIGSIVSIITDNNTTLNDILTQHVITNGYLEDIVKYTKPILKLGNKFDKMIAVFNDKL